MCLIQLLLVHWLVTWSGGRDSIFDKLHTKNYYFGHEGRKYTGITFTTHASDIFGSSLLGEQGQHISYSAAYEISPWVLSCFIRKHGASIVIQTILNDIRKIKCSKTTAKICSSCTLLLRKNLSAQNLKIVHLILTYFSKHSILLLCRSYREVLSSKNTLEDSKIYLKQGNLFKSWIAICSWWSLGHGQVSFVIFSST